MFNNNPLANGRSGAGSQQDDFFSFLNPANWNKFGAQPAQDSTFAQPQQHHVFGHGQNQHQQHNVSQFPQHQDSGYGQPPNATASTGDMDWTSTSDDFHSGFTHDDMGTPSVAQETAQLGSMGSFQSSSNSSGGGVGRLVAQFENKDFNPPLPPRPSQQVVSSPAVNSPPPSTSFGMFDPSSMGSLGSMNSMAQHSTSPLPQSPPINTHFGSFSSIDPNRVQSPVATPMDNGYGSFPGQSRVASPMLASPESSMPFTGFHDSRVSTPTAGPSSSNHFGSLDDFMSSSIPQSSGMGNPAVPVPSRNTSTPAAPGTPGFAIWRPPPSTLSNATPKPAPSDHPTPTTPGGGFFRPPPPPVPPKPTMNTGNQFILEFNPASKPKPKAPAKPPRPRAPSTVSVSTFSPEIKQEPISTPLSETPTAPTPGIISTARSSVSLRAQAGSRPSREQVPAEAWESYKSTIRTLYLEERKPLKEVMAIMAEKYGFQATPKMYKTRFSAWGFVKNNTEDEVKRLLSMKFQRDAEGKVSEFVRNGKIVNLGTYLKRKGVTEYDLIDFEQPAELPAHIRCRTPTPPLTPEHLRSPDLLRAQELLIGNVRKAYLQCRQSEVESQSEIPWPSMMIWGACSSDLLVEANFYFEAMDADQGGHCMMEAFQVLEGDLPKLSPQGINEVLLGMVQRDPGMMTAFCKYLSAYSSTHCERTHPFRQIFGCLYEVQQKHGATTLSDLLWASMPAITEELEAIYSRRHPYLVRAWLDLAMFYGHVNAERLSKLAVELRPALRNLEQRFGTTSSEAIALRYTIAQLFFAAEPQSDAAKHSTLELWDILKSGGFMSQIRDNRPNAYCFHCPVKVDPWSKRCRRRYDSLVAMFEQHAGVKVMPYFEEDFHMTEHAHDPQESWAAAMGQSESQDPWAAAMNQQGGSSGWGFL
ncbi:hypothetical protein NLU13_1573 [Sarocladium strictum]|uniref:Clr5 domain-containing protein n=1 Tax=Sarocladium strictum TaxID=5046 RepID=A0AA39LCH7_SARSR|nr:hypothetical protein NLU13_1573 [Sarocladium strictum]